ncbi:MAG TPA: amidohydrolase family protein [Candidatus Binataceae bacterium]|nr:amidohydrolase family protein [Candidatus Binataceae bacterium]
MSGKLSSKEIRKRIGHPVVDADGHWLEFGPSINDYMKEVAGADAVTSFRRRGGYVVKSLAMTPEERAQTRRAQEAFWGVPAKNTLDRATAMLPRLLYDRLDEFGFDFTVLYPTAGLALGYIPEDEVRRASCRAFNMYIAHQFGEFSDRMTPAAAIPMHTPQEAIAELDYVVKELGLKVIVMTSMVPRAIPALDPNLQNPEMRRWGTYADVFGIDSPYNYDAVWAKCVELGVMPTFHAGTRGAGYRTSPTNFVYNHIGHFAVAGEAVAKGLFLGGVTRRFPTLKFAFLEGGVGWACSLYSDLIGHWKKRNRDALEEVNPANLDRKLIHELFARFGGNQLASQLEASAIFEGLGATGTGNVKDLDDFSACGIKRAEDIRDLFTRNFYFGCEADDPINAWAFNARVNPYKARIKTLLGSDIGHFDVVNMNEVLEEAYELVDDGLISEEDFREFTFLNPVRFWAEGRPDFFKGTVLESEASSALREPQTSHASA